MNENKHAAKHTSKHQLTKNVHRRYKHKILQRWRGESERASFAALACLDIGITLSTARGGARTQRPQGARVSTQLPYSSYGHLLFETNDTVGAGCTRDSIDGCAPREGTSVRDTVSTYAVLLPSVISYETS